MNVIAIDDEKLSLIGLLKSIEQAIPSANIHGFSKAQEAIRFAQENPVDVAFLDIQMDDTDGITLAKRLKMVHPKVNIVFATGYSEHACTAISLRASGYIMKPVTPKKVLAELKNLRNPIVYHTEKKIRIQCFGDFEAFAAGEPINFQYSKTKELLAYLVDRCGALCTNGALIATLWEDDANASKKYTYYKKLRADLLSIFESYDCSDCIINRRGKIAIVPQYFDCDYYDWRDSKLEAINAYQGEYMAQYSWAEITLSEIENTKN